MRRFFSGFLFFVSLGFLFGEEDTAPPFPLIPLLETAVSGELRWRPDWPPEIPPDAFSAGGRAERGAPREILLAGGAGTFTLRRDEAGRLRVFPFFSKGKSLQAEFEYGRSGDIGSVKTLVPGEDPWRFEFPEGFLPYGGGSAVSLPVKASRGGAVFYVFFFEAPGFLSETWYDGDGNFLVYYKAEIYRDSSSWRVRSLEKRDAAGADFEDRSFDSEGNITELSSPEGIFTALYRLKRPLYWTRPPALTDASALADAGASADASAPADTPADAAEDLAASPEAPVSFILQWDERGYLTIMKSAETKEGDIAEYRYEYDLDPRGNWTKRQGLSMTSGFGLLIPGAGLSWIRQITYPETAPAGGE
ncbi:MAG: hypothetical protein LBJ90_01825 [Treponema sp.]|nr:hypothetical protein [Treponema sp.]